MRRPSRDRAALLVAAAGAIGVQAVLGPVARAADGPDPARDGVLGLAGAVVHVDRVTRGADGLEVTLTLADRGRSDLLYYTAVSYRREVAKLGVDVLDPATGRVGRLRCAGQTCRIGGLPTSLGAGRAVTVVAVVDDPGGTTVDVIFDGFQPVLGVAVEGDGAPSSGSPSTLAGRSFTPSPRTEEAGAGVTDGRIDLDTDVLFAFGSAKLSPRANETIAVAARILAGQPRRRLAISGHTDGVGTPQANLLLSRQRAEAVRVALATALGPGWTFDVQGFGETRPVAAERTASGGDYPAGRARNRRVELRLAG